MRKLLVLFFTVFLISADVEVAGVNYSSEIIFQGESFKLNGAGSRERFFIDLYTIGLYSKKVTKVPSYHINGNENRLFRIVVTSSLITADRFTAALDDGFEKTTDGNITPITNEITTLKKGFGANFHSGDEFYIYLAKNGETKIYKSFDLKVSIPANKIFQKALIKIWLGEYALVGSLKDDLLGKE